MTELFLLTSNQVGTSREVTAILSEIAVVRVCLYRIIEAVGQTGDCLYIDTWMVEEMSGGMLTDLIFESADEDCDLLNWSVRTALAAGS